ncbi:MAG TPA: YbgC/FadM family acyl-CoA thioesterase [Aeromonadales bacterium]|nr:YbgC/FadM family acyl-CoA thioesterase [Aeromonadales bacterium]
MTEFCYPVRVYYEDTDFAQVVYHANYLKFMERARTEWIREFGVEQDEMIAGGHIFAVSNLQISYLKAARFNDQLLVVSRITHCGFASFSFHQQVCHADDRDTVFVDAEVKVVSTTFPEMKPCGIPRSLREEIKRVI